MENKLQIILVSVSQILAVLLFCAGFFPIKTPVPGYANFHEVDDLLRIISSSANLNSTYQKKCVKDLIHSYKDSNVEKLVFVVIDALRTDFVLSRSGSPMKFVRSLVDSQSALGFSAITQSPTVTMPRIKALTAGTVPAFVDVALNLVTSEFKEDNWVEQIHRKNRSVAFFGDDTWTRLFPTHFRKIDATTSFFVSDYTEVDNNVTRNMDWALNANSDWDVMILHYLGLDHIGHSFGPRSHLVPEKLQEMDRVLERIYKFLATNFKKSLILVLGDHGMSEIGSHGGASAVETGVPAVFISPAWEGLDWHKFSRSMVQEIQQIDVVPTLAAILGTPVPQNNLGILIRPVLDRIFEGKLDKIALASWRTAMQIQRVGIQNRKSPKNTRNLDRLTQNCATLLCTETDSSKTISNLVDDFLAFAAEIRKDLMVSFTEYNLSFMLFGSALSITILLVLILHLKNLEKTFGSDSVLPIFLIFGLGLQSVSYASSSFVEEEHQISYFLWVSLLCLLLKNKAKTAWTSRKTFGKSAKLQIFLLLCLHRILRSWNRTGVKWLHIPDLADWLNREDNEIWKVLTIFGSCLAILCLNLHKASGKFISKMLFLLGLGCAVWFQLICANFKLPGLTIETHRGLVQARLVFLIAICICVLEKTVSGSAILLVLCVLVRALDFPVIAGVLLCGKLLTNLCSDSGKLLWTLSLYYLAMVSYFYFGNSNSLGTVNVSVGYIGFEQYYPPIVALLMLIHLYAGPLLVLFEARKSEAKADTFLILLARALPISLYLILITIQRYHLFIWSVFAPKLLYEAVHTVVINTVICLIHIFSWK